MVEWYELAESERIKEVYSKYTISDFWDWWSDGEQKEMEIRIKIFKQKNESVEQFSKRNFSFIKEIASKLFLPYSASGVYINSSDGVKAVIRFVRDKATMWFGVNPRKRNWNNYGRKTFGGKDVNVQEIKFIFVDIDRIKKEGVADNVQLKNCDSLVQHILKKLSEVGWDKNYIKICSGNGVQLLIKLDYPIKMPEVVFDDRIKEYIHNNEFERSLELIRGSIGKQLFKFSEQFKNELQVSVDKSGFNIGRVAALPVTKNYKYDGFTWRGIIELKKDGSNVGLTDYLYNSLDGVENEQGKQFNKTSHSLSLTETLRKDKLREHLLIKFMLESPLPYGEINNKLWFQLKILVRDSKGILESDEFKQIHKELESKVKGELSLNLPDKKFTFDKNVVNSYCINNLLPPIYSVYNRTKLKPYINSFEYCLLLRDRVGDKYEPIELESSTSIYEDMDKCKKMFLEGQDVYNNILMSKFINSCIKKYGEERTSYYIKWLFERFFNWE